jgi:hypothetical protein
MDNDKQAHAAIRQSKLERLREKARRVTDWDKWRMEYLASRTTQRMISTEPARVMTEQERQELEEYVRKHKCPF